MKKMKGYIPTVALMLTIAFGTSAAQAGIIVGDRTGIGDDNPCEEKTGTELVGDILGGIATFVSGGIIVGDFADSNDTCGIIVGDAADAGGIIVGD